MKTNFATLKTALLSLEKLVMMFIILFFHFSVHAEILYATKAEAEEALSNARSKSEGCDINAFKEKYFLIQKYLNYEAKDAEFKDGKLVLKEHSNKLPYTNTKTGDKVDVTLNSLDPKDYPGKVFEEILKKEYHNSLRKVALIFGDYHKTKERSDNIYKNHRDLVDFFESIDSKSTNYQFQKEFNLFDGFLSQLKEKAKQNGNIPYADKLNEHDLYLLKNLLIHAQDTICRVEFSYDPNRMKFIKLDEKKYVEDSKLLPLNRMLETLRKSADLIKDQKRRLQISELSREEKTIHEAVKYHLHDLRNWLKEQSKECQAYLYKLPIKDNFNSVQTCNYRKFMESILLKDDQFKDIESILHYINANQKHRGISPKAETDLSLNIIDLLTKKLELKEEQFDCGNVALVDLTNSKSGACVCLKDNSELDPKTKKCVEKKKPLFNFDKECTPKDKFDEEKSNTEEKCTQKDDEFDPTKACTNNEYLNIGRSKELKRCVCKVDENNIWNIILDTDNKTCKINDVKFDFKRDCIPAEEYDENKSKIKCEVKKKFDFDKDCDKEKHDKGKSEKADSCTDKDKMTKCEDSFFKDKKGYNNLSWSMNENKCVCTSNDNACCSASAISEDESEDLDPEDRPIYAWNKDKQQCENTNVKKPLKEGDKKPARLPRTLSNEPGIPYGGPQLLQVPTSSGGVLPGQR